MILSAKIFWPIRFSRYNHMSMERTPAPQWYLEVEGKRAGPFDLGQIQGLLADGEILPNTPVSQSPDTGPWLKAADLAAANGDHQAIEHPAESSSPSVLTATTVSTSGAAGSGSGHLPNRPSDGVSLEPTHRKPEGEDTTTQIFDVLQAMKDRKMAKKLTAPHPQEWGQLARGASASSRRLPPQVLVIGAIASFLCISLWGVSRILDRGESAPIADAENSSAKQDRPVETIKTHAKPQTTQAVDSHPSAPAPSVRTPASHEAPKTPLRMVRPADRASMPTARSFEKTPDHAAQDAAAEKERNRGGDDRRDDRDRGENQNGENNQQQGAEAGNNTDSPNNKAEGGADRSPDGNASGGGAGNGQENPRPDDPNIRGGAQID